VFEEIFGATKDPGIYKNQDFVHPDIYQSLALHR
jgi:hypothetical protein